MNEVFGRAETDAAGVRRPLEEEAAQRAETDAAGVRRPLEEEAAQRAETDAAGVRQPLEEEAAQRAAAVAEARKWMLTPYRHCADLRGVGVDCGMLIVRVFVDLGLTPPFDLRPYAPDWMIHRDDERYLEFFAERCARVKQPRPGDIVLFRYGRSYSHGGIVTQTDPMSIIHAYHEAGCVVEEQLKQNPALTDSRRRLAYFSIWPATSN